MINDILEGTSSKISDFLSDYATLYNRKMEFKQNFLDNTKQAKYIKKIYSEVHKIKDDGSVILCIINKRGLQYIEKTFKNFLLIVKHKYRGLFDKDGYCAINLDNLFEIIKTKKTVRVRAVSSIFFVEDRNYFDDGLGEIVIEKKIQFSYENNECDEEIIEAINLHWNDNIRYIIEHIVASLHTTDKKNLWLLILANSNFGKSKLFDWMRDWGGTVFVNYSDMKTGGISNKSPDEFDGKLCFVIDEVMKFPRAMFDIEGEILIRPMRNHSIRVPVNSKILLSADGGTFNLEYVDKQISNRVCIMDFRGGSERVLGELAVVSEYGEYKIKRAMTNYLYMRVVKRQKEYLDLNIEDRRRMADNNIKWIFNKFKQKKMDFFDIVKRDIYEIIDNPQQLDDRHRDVWNVGTLYYSVRHKQGIIIVRPSEVLPRVLKHYNTNIAYELEYKTVEQIAKAIKGFEMGVFKVGGKTVRGLFVPYRAEIVIEEMGVTGAKINA